MIEGIYFCALLVLIFAGIVVGSIILALDLETRKVPAALRGLFLNTLPKLLPFVVITKPKADTVRFLQRLCESKPEGASLQLTIDKVLNGYVKGELGRGGEKKKVTDAADGFVRVQSANGEPNKVTVANHYSSDDLQVDPVEERELGKGELSLEAFLAAVRGVVDRWGEVVGTVAEDLAKERDKADWKNFVSVLERLLMFFFFLLWLLILVFTVGWHGWY